MNTKRNVAVYCCTHTFVLFQKILLGERMRTAAPWPGAEGGALRYNTTCADGEKAKMEDADMDMDE